MAFWSVREELSQADRLRRSYYELLRDELDQFMLQYALIDSYSLFVVDKTPYPFVEKRELKPRARIPTVEYECQNAFLAIFVEDTIPPANKKYIRFFDDNKTTKINLLRSEGLSLSDKFDRSQKYLDSVHFYNFLKVLIPVDYALLIQRDHTSRLKNRYSLSHFHVRIDWPIANAAEDLARNLRYISKDLYEKGEKYAEDIQRKFFEYYGIPVTVGGRRTAAIVASQYMKQFPFITTVYAGSCESRSLIRISERGVSKSILMKFSTRKLEEIAETNNLSLKMFKKNYVVVPRRKDSVCIFQTTYAPTSHARPADEGKLREIRPDLNWITVDAQHILPKPGVWEYPPIPLNVIYS
ncbi:MAG: hypothetical protein QF888_00430 [Desulfobacterales bacterium]|nr:hypothetical protein [Desulfobacterales bacterium]MDP7416439.1 hypothetical protein [Desulfobacterales bacterium]